MFEIKVESEVVTDIQEGVDWYNEKQPGLSSVPREVVDRFEFDSFYHAKHTLNAHRNWYDNTRLYRSIGMTPLQKWEQNIHITERKRAERSQLQTTTEISSEISRDTNKHYTTNSLLFSN